MANGRVLAAKESNRNITMNISAGLLTRLGIHRLKENRRL